MAYRSCAVVFSLLALLVLLGKPVAADSIFLPAGDNLRFVDGDEETIEEEEDPSDPGLFRRYYPLWLNDELTPEVDDVLLGSYLLNLLPFGGLWGPLVLLEDDHPDMSSDVILSYLVPAITSCLFAGVLWGGGLGVSLGFSVVVGALATVFPPCGALACIAFPCGIGGMCVGVPIYLGGLLYVTPTAVVNAWDRAYKYPEAADGPRKKRKSKKKKGDRPEAHSDDSGTAPVVPAPDASEDDEDLRYGY